MQVTVSDVQRALGDTVYRVERELGAGGMATVFLAEDIKHGRRVAIKVLRPELAAAIGVERFLNEIRTTANLQHPHLLPLHDSGSAGGLLYYVMPFIPGESLRQRLRREKQLRVDDAVRIIREVASGLDYAHRHHVVHRDIKPENILLHDGQALVADFGIALAADGDESQRMTGTGLILGTPAYMSPEQAMGEREITYRSDIYALGCVLHEMLAGEPPFTGSTVQSVITRILADDPAPIGSIRKLVPRHIETAVLTALAKVPADRFVSVAAFAEALTSPPADATTLVLPRPMRWRAGSPLLLGAAGLGLLAAGVVTGRTFLASPASPASAARVSLRVPPDLRLHETTVGALALSPDGSRIAYSGERDGTTQLFVRRLDDFMPVALAGTEGAAYPRFSPDGGSIDFVGLSGMLKVSAEGGTPTASELPPSAWDVLRTGPSEWLARGSDGSLVRGVAGGATETIARPDSTVGESGLLPLEVLPGNRALVLALQGGDGRLGVVDLRTGARTQISPDRVVWGGYHDGYLAWLFLTGALMAAPWDPADPTKLGPPMMIAPTVRVGPGQPAQVALSSSGALAYIPARPAELVRIDRAGNRTTIGDQPRRFHGPRISPDGRLIAVDVTDQQRDIWVLHRGDGTFSRVTFDGDGHDPTWLPDGRAFLYATSRGGAIIGVNRRRADGSGASDSVWSDGLQTTIHAVTPDSRYAIGAYVTGYGGFNLTRVPLGASAGARATVIADGRASESHPALSPDGRWLAYTSDESGRFEVYVRSIDDGGGRVQISRNGGQEPMWSRDGRELFYLTAEAPAMRYSIGSVATPTSTSMVAVRLEFTPEPRVSSRTSLFDASDFTLASPHANYDVTPDGAFIYVRTIPADEIVYVQHWTALFGGRKR